MKYTGEDNIFLIQFREELVDQRQMGFFGLGAGPKIQMWMPRFEKIYEAHKEEIAGRTKLASASRFVYGNDVIPFDVLKTDRYMMLDVLDIMIDDSIEQLSSVTAGASSPNNGPVEGLNLTFTDVNESSVGSSVRNIEPPFDERGRTKIGDVYLNIPPEQIAIIDANSIIPIPVIRSSSTVKLRTGTGQIRVELNIEVASIEDFNNRIRPLLAQIKRSPWLPIQNWHLKNILLPVNPLENPDIVSELVDIVDITTEDPADNKDEQGGASKIHTADQQTLQGTTPKLKRKIIKGKNKLAGIQAKEPSNISDMDLFIVIHSISIQTVPGYPGSFYVNLTSSVFNHIPYLDKIRYLVDDSDVKTVIDVHLENRKRVKATSRYNSEKILHDFRDLDVNTTTDISMSKVFKKYYQGLLSEYLIDATIDQFDGSPAKTYVGLPYRAVENEIMHPLTPDGAQDILLRGWVDPRSTRELIDTRINALTAALHKLIGMPLSSEKTGSAGSLAHEGIKELWEGTVEVIQLMHNYIPSMLHKALDDNKWTTSNKEGNLYIMNKKRTEWVPIEEYLESARDDEKTKDLVALVKGLEDVRIASLDNDLEYVKVDVALTNSEQTTVTGVTARYNTHVVPINMQAHEFPTMQNMGRGEFSCTINVQTTDFDLVRKIRFLNFLLNRTKRRYDRQLQSPHTALEGLSENKDIRQIRRAFFKDFSIEVLSKDFYQSNFLNALGIKRVLITDATYSTVKGSPGLWSITMTLMQNDLDIIRQEAIFSGNRLTSKLVENVIKYLKKLGEQIEAGPQPAGPRQEGQEDVPLPKSKIWEELARDMNKWYGLLSDKNIRDERGDIYKNSIDAAANTSPVPSAKFIAPSLKAIVDTGVQSEGQANLAIAQSGVTIASYFLMGPLGPLLGAMGIVARSWAGRALLEVATLAEGYRIIGRVRSFLIRTDIASQLPEFLVDELISAFKKADPGFDVCYPDLALPGFNSVDPDDPLEVAKHPSIYTSPDFYVFKETLFTDEMLSLAKTYNSLFTDLVSEIERINKVDKSGHATLPLHELRDTTRTSLVEKASTIKEDLAERLELERQDIAVQLDQVNQLLDGKPAVGAPTSEYSIDKRSRDLLKDKKERLERRIRGFSDGGDITMAVEEATAEQLERYMYGFETSQSQEIADKILDDITNDMANLRYRDKTLQMAKAFPTLKVYFVEQDSNHLLSFNDVYSYNGINSVDVIWSRKSASKTAVINMTNLTGTLTDPLAIKIEEVFSFLSKEKNTALDTKEEQSVDGIYVQPGLRVIIKMGYSNDPYELENVFDGIVVSVKGGENIEIVCQSHAVELNNIIGQQHPEGIRIYEPWLGPGITWAKLTAKKVGNLFFVNQKLPPEAAYGIGYGSVVKRVFQEVGDLSHFGQASPFMESIDFQPQTSDQQFKTVLLQTLLDLVSHDVPITRGMHKKIYHWMFDHKDDNIWITWNNSLPWYADTTRTRSDLTFDWFIYNQSGFDSINELLLWFPDHIFMELPYNEDNLKMQRSTLYIGPRAGLYLSEDIDPITNPRVFNEWREFITQKTWADRLIGTNSRAEVTDEGLVRISVTTPDSFGTPPNRINDIDLQGEALFPVRPPLFNPPEPNSKYGRRRDPNDSSKFTFHHGVDYDVDKGTPIVATIDGIVEQTNHARGGWIMKIRNRRTTVGYYHLSQRNIESGVFVKAGQIIGATGGLRGQIGSGNSTGDHLHYQVEIDGKTVDPEDLSLIMKGIKKDQDRQRLNPNELSGDQSAAVNEALRIMEKKKDAFELRAEGPIGGNINENLRKRFSEQIDFDKKNIDIEATVEGLYTGQNRDVRPRNPEDLVGAPGFSRVTRSHFFDSIHHIVSNDIVASTENMWNRVILKYPEVAPIPHQDAKLTRGRSYLEGESIWKDGTNVVDRRAREFFSVLRIPGLYGRQKIKEFDLWLDHDMDSINITPTISFQKNIDLGVYETVGFFSNPTIGSIPMYYRIANSILANGMREMYTGSITVLLDPSIRPWDRCHIFDYHNQMYGPISVESVHHHFDFQTGATTTIVPDLIVHQNNYPSVVRDAWMQNLMEANLALKVGGTFMGLLSGARFGSIGMAIGGLSAFAASSYQADKLFFALGGYLLGRESGLTFSGLWKDGIPLTAGTKGMRKETMFAMVADKIHILTAFTEKILGVSHG